MADDLYNKEQIEKAVAMFEGQELGAPEALLASARLFVESLARFRKEAPAFREKVGEDNIRRFATEDMNEVIYEIQDTVPVAIRIFNAMMRDPDDKKGSPE